MPLKPSVEVHVIDGHLVAEFWDCLRMDPAPVQALQRLYDDHLRQGGKAGLILDLKGVEFIGSAVLGGILKIHRTAGRNDARLAFCSVDPIVRDTFRVSHVENLFLYFDDREEALRHYTQGPDDPPPPVQPHEVPADGPKPPTGGARPGGRSGGPLSSRRKSPGAGS